MNDVKLIVALSSDRKSFVNINDADKNKIYYCPICGNEVYPKALYSSCIRMHYCHRNAECSKEGIPHLIAKYNMVDVDKLQINNEILYFDKRKTLIEQSYNTKFGNYKPDLTLFTTNGVRIFLEIKDTCPKNSDYIIKYNELSSDVIEYDINNQRFYFIFRDGNYCGKHYKNQKTKAQVDFNNYINALNCDENRERKLYDFWLQCRKYNITRSDEYLINAINNLDEDDLLYATKIISDFRCCDNIRDSIRQIVWNKMSKKYISSVTEIIDRNPNYIDRRHCVFLILREFCLKYMEIYRLSRYNFCLFIGDKNSFERKCTYEFLDGVDDLYKKNEIEDKLFGFEVCDTYEELLRRRRTLQEILKDGLSGENMYIPGTYERIEINNALEHELNIKINEILDDIESNIDLLNKGEMIKRTVYEEEQED